MRTAAFIAALALTVGCATSQPLRRAPLQKSTFRPLAEKPQTQIQVNPHDAAQYWKRIVPAHLAALPTVTNSFVADAVYTNFIRISGMSTGEYVRLDGELNEFKRTHAHSFWEPYVGKRITVAGGHYCPCCFYAAIGYSGRGYTDGWTIRLDEYIAIGFPQGSTCYTDDPGAVGMTKCPLFPLRWIVQAVGTVSGPREIADDLGTMEGQALAYYVLEQSNKKTSNKMPRHVP
ncbi:MAG TPA: hypothetical protein PKM57_12625 [Kiritimatiellia bacterium]|nr:hypothetical protein [Kiritimatiellia bacterium]HPS07220.1 hypothetical protein [Kiritimatiellia bacterium]